MLAAYEQEVCVFMLYLIVCVYVSLRHVRHAGRVRAKRYVCLCLCLYLIVCVYVSLRHVRHAGRVRAKGMCVYVYVCT